ncbi:MAG TPA: ABC transporter substrate binding protein [Chloroflexota bacterium]
MRIDAIAATAASIAEAMQLTTTIPLVFLTSSDPVAEGLVPNLAHPGGNVTGVTTNPAEIAAKRVELLKTIRPGLARLAYLWDPALPAHASASRFVQRAVSTFGMTVLSHEVRAAADVPTALGELERAAIDGLLAQSSAPLIGAWSQIASFAIGNGIVTATGAREYAAAGALLSYSVNAEASQRRAPLTSTASCAVRRSAICRSSCRVRSISSSTSARLAPWA